MSLQSLTEGEWHVLLAPYTGDPEKHPPPLMDFT